MKTKKVKPVEEAVKKKKKKVTEPDLPWDEEKPKKKSKKVSEVFAEEKPKKKKKKSKEQAELQDALAEAVGTKKKKGGATVINVSGREEVIPDSKEKVKLPMVVGKDDYIIVRVGARCKLGFAHNPERNACYLEETLQDDEPVVFEYDEKTLIAVVGPDPEIGTAFGVHIEPQRSETEHALGPLVYFRKMKKEEKKALKWGMDKAVETLKAEKLDDILPIKRVEIRNKKGKYAGHYVIKRKGDDVSDKIVLHPQVLEDAKYNFYVVMHEAAHALWFRKMSDEFRARWLVSYNEHTHVNKAKKSQLESMLKKLIESQATIREFAKDLEDDEDKALYREILAYLKRHHKLSPQDCNLLLTHNSQVLGEIWPTSASLSESDLPISAYAATSVEEFFAEALSLSMTKTVNLPKKIEKLLQKTLKHIRGN